MGLLPPTATLAGEVRVERARASWPAARTRSRPYRWNDIAMVFQGAMNALNPVKKVGWQIAEPMAFHGVAEGAAARRRAGELLELVGIPAAAAERYPHEFSGGMRQRAAIAMALACQPKILLADEPTTALDVMVQAQILELLTRLSSELGLALVLVTHDLPVVAQVCERAAVMYAGEIVGAGPDGRAVPHRRGTRTPGCCSRRPRPVRRRRGGLDPRRAAAAGPGDHRLPVPAALRLGVRAVRGRAPGAERGAAGSPGRLPPHPPPGRRRQRDMTEAPLLEVESLVTHYPVRPSLTERMARRPREWVHAVDGVSFSLARGEMLALVGESGCGKTTTAQTILRHGRAHRGDDPAERHRHHRRCQSGRLRPLRRKLQMIYQDPYESLDPRFRVARRSRSRCWCMASAARRPSGGS